MVGGGRDGKAGGGGDCWCGNSCVKQYFPLHLD